MVDAETADALREGLDDEYKARATYRKVIELFGPVRPFVNIVEAEERHIRALLTQFERLGIEPPADAWRGRVTAPRTLRDACAAAVQAEIDNAALYQRLMSKAKDARARAVMERLQEASQERHLPAFRRCLAREEAGGSAPGPRGARDRRQARGRR